MDNLCRNPDLVVLVPASQEAEPLEIQVTLHPRVPTPTPLPRRQESTVYRPLAVPQSPKLSTPTSPPSITAPLLQVSEAPRPEDAAGDHYRSIVAGTEQQTSVGAECIVEGQQHTPELAESGTTAARLKRRDHLWLPFRRSRQQSNVGGRGSSGRTRTAPVSNSPVSSPKAEEMAGAMREVPAFPVIGARLRRSGGGGGSGMFASLTRRRGRYRSWKERSSASTWRSVPLVPVARDSSVDHGCPGKSQIRGGALAPVRATSPPLFVEYTTDEGGQESGPSSEEDFGDGRPRRRSYIRVACTARTRYKLFSSDPQVGSTKERERRLYCLGSV